MPKRPQKLHHWRIFLSGSTPATELGSVEAHDAEEAISISIQEFGIEPAHQKRLIAQRIVRT
jgi:hypothetical protein